MENRNNRGGMRGPGMGRRPAEKSKDFKGTWMKIIRYCKRYLAVIVVALDLCCGRYDSDNPRSG